MTGNTEAEWEAEGDDDENDIKKHKGGHREKGRERKSYH